MHILRTWNDPITLKTSGLYPLEFTRGEKKLSYYGSHHSNNPDDPMFTAIEKMFESCNPELVLVEGVQQLRRDRPADSRHKLLAWIKDQSKSEIIRAWGDNGFTAWLGQQRELPVFSPESAESDEIRYLATCKFTREDIFLHYLLRQVEQCHRMQLLPEFEAYLTRGLEQFKQNAQWSDFDFSQKNLEAAAERHWPGQVNLRDFDFVRGKTWPVRWDSVTNDIARACTDFRDQEILNEIQYHLSHNNRIFVVFGATHAVRQEPALQALFR